MPESRLPTAIRWGAIVKVVCLIALLITANLGSRLDCTLASGRLQATVELMQVLARAC